MAVIGAKSEATPAVPLYWNRKRVIEDDERERHDEGREARC